MDKIEPNWKAVAVDDTRYWKIADEDRYYIEKILTVYFYNANETTYCCEITPSYFMQWLQYLVVFKLNTPDEVRERISERYEIGERGEDCYMHCSKVDKMLDQKSYGKVSEDTTEDDVREYWQSNCPF